VLETGRLSIYRSTGWLDGWMAGVIFSLRLGGRRERGSNGKRHRAGSLPTKPVIMPELSGWLISFLSACS
jgi:hypothetical protein